MTIAIKLISFVNVSAARRPETTLTALRRVLAAGGESFLPLCRRLRA
jgi:hypothetical protein